jgi:alginate biosynthesis protein Alg44
LTVPFTALFGDSRLEGIGLSVAAAYVQIGGPLDPRWLNHRAPVRLQFDFENFSVQLDADVVVAGSRGPGEMTLQFVDPLGPHLPQLRHILNSYISGDLVTLGSFLSYTGPTKPKAAKGEETGKPPLGRRLRSFAVALVSLAAIGIAATLMIGRATQVTELRPIFISREGREMRATTAGQVSYLNPQAQKGEVVFSINSNSGDVLNFQLPCDCTVEVTDGIYEGATVLPIDVILSTFDSNVGIRVQTQISIEGLSKYMDGAAAYLDLDDGRNLPATIETSSATNIAAERGDLFVPVYIVPTDPAALTTADIGKTAHLRLVNSWLNQLITRTNGDAT